MQQNKAGRQKEIRIASEVEVGEPSLWGPQGPCQDPSAAESGDRRWPYFKLRSPVAAIRGARAWRRSLPGGE